MDLSDPQAGELERRVKPYKLDSISEEEAKRQAGWSPLVRKSISCWGMLLVDFDRVGWVRIEPKNGYSFDIMSDWRS